MSGSTTRRVSDGAVVRRDEAVELWASAGRTVLERAAPEYGGLLTYSDMADAVQDEAGVTTGMLVRVWIGEVLGRIARIVERPDEPMLTSLVVHADHSIGEGYGEAVMERYGFLPADLDLHAAEERPAAAGPGGRTVSTGPLRSTSWNGHRCRTPSMGGCRMDR
jgi:hypothetical protein